MFEIEDHLEGFAMLNLLLLADIQVVLSSLVVTVKYFYDSVLVGLLIIIRRKTYKFDGLFRGGNPRGLANGEGIGVVV